MESVIRDLYMVPHVILSCFNSIFTKINSKTFLSINESLSISVNYFLQKKLHLHLSNFVLDFVQVYNHQDFYGPELSGVTHVSVMAIISGFLGKEKLMLQV